MAENHNTFGPEPDIERYVEPTDRRPEFVAEGLSPRFRLGLLAATLFVDALLFAIVLTAAIPSAAPSGFLSVASVGLLLGLSFFLFVIFGALVGNNPQLGSAARIAWWLGFIVAGPITLPCYWLVHVWSHPYRPAHDPAVAHAA